MSASIRVLYIDDDAGLGRLMQRALTSKGMEIAHVESGQEGLQHLAENSVDIIALDHDLGTESGLDVLSAIRAMPSPPPVIYVTGSEDVRVAVAALKAGAVDYVWKDIQGHYRDLLVESIGAALMQARLQREKERAELEVREGRERAEILLSEVNHRVANSLALVSSLTRLQANAVVDASAKIALQEMQARIAAIAGIHRRLYTSSDVRIVEMDAYLESLAQELGAAMSAEAKSHPIKLDVETNLSIATDKAVSIGVLVTELVTNAFKYAYSQNAEGPVRITFRRIAPTRLRLVVEDDGIGLSDTSEAQGTGIGSRIIHAMAANLGSVVAYDPHHRGTRAVLEFES